MNGPQAWPDERPGPSSQPRHLVSIGFRAENLTCRRVEHAPGVEEVNGAVADAQTTEVHDTDEVAVRGSQ